MAPGTAAAAPSPEATGTPSGNKVINADPATAVSGIAQSTIAPDAAVQGVITQGTILPSGPTPSPGAPQMAQTEKPVSTVSLAVSAQAAQWPLMAAMPEAAKAPAAEGVTAPSIGGAKATPFGAVKAPARTALAASDGTDQTATAPARSAVSADLGTATLASASPAETTTPQLRDTLSFAADPLSSVANSAAPRVDMGAGYETSRDMSALVDRLVETRAAMRSSAPSQWVSTSIQHAEFGRVSLQIRQDGSDLSVAMTSQDPSFAPAAQAALHSAQSLLQPAAASQSSADNTQDNHQSSQQGQQAQANGNGSSFGNPSSGGQSGSPSGGQERQTPWRQQAPFALDNPSAATQAPAKDETSGAKPSGRSGLLA